jgi:hypothetical protein
MIDRKHSVGSFSRDGIAVRREALTDARAD